MFYMKLVDYVFQVENKYDFVARLCKDYTIVDPVENVDYVISVSDEEIQKENIDGGNWTNSYLESLAVYRKICELLLDQDIVLFHCSALEMRGKALLFTAASGTGKSTHTRLWREHFGDEVTMVNDDKPLLAIRDDKVYVYGTPYGGKDNIQTNTHAKVAGIFILHQAKENTLKKVPFTEAYPMLLNQTYRKKDAQGMIKTMDLVSKLSCIPTYELGCTISDEAVQLVYHEIFD